ncbi:MAG: 1-acyl-sn-glycerol-3-phosphate acyltransferase [Minwuia sp.]|nr:1-acyl-sn-glycerol-3-phosphate acyltransferase [Minwuia sp.]
MRTAYITLIILFLVLFTLIIMPPHLLGILFGWRISRVIPQLWHQVAFRLLRLTIRIEGTPVRNEGVLYVSNHVSWVDIVVMGATLPASFVAKHEVGTWPVIKWLANLQRTVYVSRDRKTADKERKAMQERLARGDSLILFPEGTSGDGLRIQEFRSAFFALADLKVDDKPVKVQPISLTYTRVDGFPVTRRSMPRVAWYGDMDLAPHLKTYLYGGPYEVRLKFHDPVTLDEIGNRKRLAAYCQEQVIAGNSEALSASAA